MKLKNTIKSLALACLMMTGAVAYALPLVPGTSFNAAALFLSGGDFNGDGNMDLIESASGSVRVSLGDGTGGFTSLPSQSFAPITGVLVSLVYDMDGDGNDDLLLYSTTTLYKAISLGDGTFSTPTQLTTFPGNAKIADAVDMNGDGLIDFVGFDATGGMLLVILATNATTYAPPAVYLPTGSLTGYRPVNVADVNGDGFPDVVVESNAPNQLEVFLGDGTGAFGTISTYPLSFATQGWGRLADLNGDNKPDFVTKYASTTGSGFYLDVLLNNGAGGFPSENSVYLGNVLYEKVEIADFNLDGKLDTLTAGFGVAIVNLGDGAGGFAAPQTFSSGTDNVWGSVVGDINGDTTPDVVLEALVPNTFLSFAIYPLINMNTTNPLTGTIAINAGAATTTSSNVTLDLSCTTSTGSACASGTTMELSNDGTAWTPAAPWATSVPWVLAPGLGIKTVNVRFTDANGNISTANDTIEVLSPSSGGGCLAASQPLTLYLFMLFGLLFAALQIKSRRS